VGLPLRVSDYHAVLAVQTLRAKTRFGETGLARVRTAALRREESAPTGTPA